MTALTHAQALTAILERCPIMQSENIPIAQSIGRILAQDLSAMHASPKATISAMDGFAIAIATLQSKNPKNQSQTYPIIGESAAGKPFLKTVPQGSCIKIFTGALLPEGTDLVVITEQADNITRNQLRLQHSIIDRIDQRYVRHAGMDFTQGEICLPKYTKITIRDLALMAAMNITHCHVLRQPKIAIAATGDELIPLGDLQTDWTIPSSNDVALAAMFPLYGALITNYTCVQDNKTALASWLQQALPENDLIVMTGGVSIGDYDYVPEIMANLPSFTPIFHGINLKPGKPTLFGICGDKLLFGLPGNPVSTLLAAILLILPAIAKMLAQPTELTKQSVILASDLPKEGNRTHYRRAQLHYQEGKIYATALQMQDSAQLKNLARADGLIICPANSRAKSKGMSVNFMPFPAPLTQF